jgi:PAS domain S-box-containing protein
MSLDISHLFRPILESIKEAVIVRDLNGKISYANRWTKNIFGYAQEDVNST